MTTKGYKGIDSNQPLAAKRFRKGKEWYVRLWVDYPDNDLLLTFGPLDLEQAKSLQTLLQVSYCHVWEQWEAPFEGDERTPASDESE